MLKVVGASWMKIRMSTWIIGVVLVLGVVIIVLGMMGQTDQDGNYAATAYWFKDTGFEIKFWGQGMQIDEIPKGAARIYFQPQTETTGWTVIDILTQSSYPDWVQAYAAGMLEGSLSWQLIYSHWKNTVQYVCENREVFCNYIRKYLEENLRFIENNFKQVEDPYWHQVYLFYVQLEGLQHGFEHGVKRSRQNIEQLKLVDFLWMNAASDITDLEFKFFDTKPYVASPNNSQTRNDLSDSVLLKKIRDSRSVNGHSWDNENVGGHRPQLGCGVSLGSTFIKLLPEEGKLLVAHNSAGPYVSMLKMIKRYQFKFHWSSTNFWVLEKKLSFSSYPGAIHSMDDFYVVSVDSKYLNMVITGTPLTVFSKKLWHHVKPYHQVLSGPRAIVASRLSQNASAWGEIFFKYNSGTGNKQWLIIDAELFTNISRLRADDEQKYKKELENAKNILWVAEQIPGSYVKQDQTQILKSRTYWAGYGLPFYENISSLIEMNKMCEIYGDAFSYEKSPLAKIYKRDHEKATSLDNTMKLMRSNSFRKDPFSMGNPRCAIGARGDIPTKNTYTFPIGVIDSKVFIIGGEESGNKTEPQDASEQFPRKTFTKFEAIAGPAYSRQCSTTESDCTDNDRIEPFNWATSKFADFPHEGHPDSWEFDPIVISC